jgi:eukaryotic-like serine/threonine-protein kinase
MPAPTTMAEFFDLGYRSGLLERGPMEALSGDWGRAGFSPQTPREVGDALIREGVLTHFQAEKLLAGRWRGFVISGKYRLLESLGRGGMGDVYLCEHILMGRKVALKVLPRKQAEDPASLARFHREARAVARLDHPNIVRAHDIDHEDKLYFLVLEFVDGINLHDFVRKNGTLTPLRAAHYVRQAALGLEHAHEAGLVHRDIKPGNVLLDRQGTVKLLDMGLARFFHEDTGAFVKEFEAGYIIGTADYVAPEQIIDSRVDVRADIYSLGGTFYYLLVGKSPFQDGNTHQKMIWHQVRQPKSLRVLRPDVPEGLIQVIDKMMAKEPARRYQTPAEVAAALEEYTRLPVLPPTEDELPPSALAGCGKPLSSEVAQSTATRTPGTSRPPGVRPSGARPSDVMLPGTPLPTTASSGPASPARKISAVST